MTEINVTVGPPTLRQQNRQQIDANRWRRAEQDAQQRTEADARAARQRQLAQQGLTAGGQARYGDPLQARFQRQKPAAFRYGEQPGFAFSGWVAYNGTGINGAYLRIYSGDASTFLEQYKPAPSAEQGVFFFTTIFFLPLTSDACVAVAAPYYYFQDDPTPNYLSRSAFIVGKSSVRLIGVPAAINAVLDAFESEDGIGEPLYENYVSLLPPRYIQYAGVGFYPSYVTPWTPKVYEIINKVAPFVSESQIIQYPHGSRLVVTDWRYSFVSPSDPKDWSLYFANWRGDPDDIDTSRPDLLDTLPAATINLPPNWPSLQFDNPDQVFGGFDFAVAWNWDRPTYCRQMCLALGFSPADLTP
jgi:hypothetical protein